MMNKCVIMKCFFFSGQTLYLIRRVDRLVKLSGLIPSGVSIVLVSARCHFYDFHDMLLPYLFTTLVLLSKSSPSAASASSQPHIVFLLVDDVGHMDLSQHRAEHDTSNIDALFSGGVELTNHCVHPTCSPTRSSLMTGMYSWKTGLQFRSTISPGTTEHLPFEFPMVAELLSQAGYATHALGKW